MLKTGSPFPDFSVLNHDGRLVTGAELRALGSLVVFFYPRANTPGCTLEAKRFRDEAPAFAAAGATIVGVSQDSPDLQACFASDHSLPFALLCDEKGDLYRAFGLKKYLGLIPRRTTFIFGPDGRLAETFDSMLNAGEHVDVALSAVQRLNPGTR